MLNSQKNYWKIIGLCQFPKDLTYFMMIAQLAEMFWSMMINPKCLEHSRRQFYYNQIFNFIHNVIYNLQAFMRDKKLQSNVQQESPSKLKTTQTILQSLYAKAMKPTNDSEALKLKNYGRSQTQIEARISSMLPKKKSLISENDLKNSQKFIPMIQSIESDHEHSANCCIHENQRIKSKLQQIDQQEMLLQSYREEVQYLKKVNLLQSEEIDKLRKMIRVQDLRKSVNKSALNQSAFEIGSRVEKLEKNQQKNGIRNSFGCKERKISRKGTGKKREHF